MALSRIGPYQLLHPLAAGGEGRLFLAQDTRLARQVVLKIKPLSTSLPDRDRAIAEARALATFSDPQIVQLYDVIELDDELALVMEYVDGPDLASLSEHVRLPLAAVLALTHDLCSAITAAHERGLRHGDIKAANVLITRSGRLKLADFGMSNGVGGSSSSLSPEQRAGQRATIRSDLFALGCLIHQLLLGAVPDAVMRGTESTLHIDPAGRLPVDLKELIASLLQGNPESRPESALELRVMLLSLCRRYPSGQQGLVQAVEMAEGRADGSRPARMPSAVLPSQFKKARDLFPNSFGRTSAASWITWALIPLMSIAGLFVYTAKPAMSVTPARLAIQIAPLQWRGPKPDSAALLEAAMHSAVLRNAAFVAGKAPEQPSASLSLSVHCNTYSCVSQIQLDSIEQRLADSCAILPDASPARWESCFEQALAQFAAQRDVRP